MAWNDVTPSAPQARVGTRARSKSPLLSLVTRVCSSLELTSETASVRTSTTTCPPVDRVTSSAKVASAWAAGLVSDSIVATFRCTAAALGLGDGFALGVVEGFAVGCAVGGGFGPPIPLLLAGSRL